MFGCFLLFVVHPNLLKQVCYQLGYLTPFVSLLACVDIVNDFFSSEILFPVTLLFQLLLGRSHAALLMRRESPWAWSYVEPSPGV
jgi:hypothetical protein